MLGPLQARRSHDPLRPRSRHGGGVFDGDCGSLWRGKGDCVTTQVPAVDAIIVHYRSHGQIERLVESLRRQRGVDMRLVIVDGGPDGSVERLDLDSDATV